MPLLQLVPIPADTPSPRNCYYLVQYPWGMAELCWMLEGERLDTYSQMDAWRVYQVAALAGGLRLWEHEPGATDGCSVCGAGAHECGCVRAGAD